MERYRKRNPTPEDKGTLRFSDLEVQPLGRMAALVLSRRHLSRAGDDLEGNFSLVFRRIDGRWLIVHDHTSLLRDEKWSSVWLPSAPRAGLGGRHCFHSVRHAS